MSDRRQFSCCRNREFMFNLRKYAILNARKKLLPLCVPDPPALPNGFLLPDPEYWEDWAREQGVGPILYRNLKDLRVLGDMDTAPRDRMERVFWDSIFHDQMIFDSAQQIASSAAIWEVDVIFLKGLAISKRYYPDSALRPSGDIDLLIHAEDIDTFKELFQSMGYEMDRPDLEILRRVEKSELRFIHQQTRLTVEIHWNFVNSRSLRKNLSFPESALWAESEIMMLDRVPIRTLSLERLVIYLCIHMAHHHQLSRLIWIVDLVQIIRHSFDVFCSPLFWNKCQESDGVRLAVAACMRLARQMFPFVPDIPGMDNLLPRRQLTKMLLNLLNSEAVLFSEAVGLKYRQKLFREALKLRA